MHVEFLAIHIRDILHVHVEFSRASPRPRAVRLFFCGQSSAVTCVQERSVFSRVAEELKVAPWRCVTPLISQSIVRSPIVITGNRLPALFRE
jgi:hypothetical protein